MNEDVVAYIAFSLMMILILYGIGYLIYWLISRRHRK